MKVNGNPFTKIVIKVIGNPVTRLNGYPVITGNFDLFIQFSSFIAHQTGNLIKKPKLLQS